MRKSLVALAAVATLAAGAVQAESATYMVEPTHTFATFEISHFGASVNRARFDKKTGTVQLDKAAKTGKVEVTIDTTSVNSGTAAFDKHLQSPDLFDAAKYPT
ncbi:MAG TPA: YceI family protein, partial [Rhodoferax sp.]|nr:YceI family protein [Rhodoferax sp.]